MSLARRATALAATVALAAGASLVAAPAGTAASSGNRSLANVLTSDGNRFDHDSSDIDTVETVLLYHVVPGATITSKQALKADGAALTTAQGGKVTVDVINPNSGKIRLQDLDPDDVDAFTLPKLLDINKGNKQIAHGISYVLRPVNL